MTVLPITEIKASQHHHKQRETKFRNQMTKYFTCDQSLKKNLCNFLLVPLRNNEESTFGFETRLSCGLECVMIIIIIIIIC